MINLLVSRSPSDSSIYSFMFLTIGDVRKCSIVQVSSFTGPDIAHVPFTFSMVMLQPTAIYINYNIYINTRSHVCDIIQR